MPAISVVMTVYNAERFLDESVPVSWNKRLQILNSSSLTTVRQTARLKE